MTVIVPVYNPGETLGPCVASLERQDYPGRFEVLLVDNGSTDDSVIALGALPSHFRVLREARRGASHARNAGIAAARSELLAFTDADCVARPDWLQNLVAAWRDSPQVQLLGGQIAALEPTNALGRFSAFAFDQQAAVEVYAPPCIITANFLTRRRDMETLGLFNAEYLRSQDVELSYRAHFQHAARFIYCADAIVDHHNMATLSALFHKGWQHGRGGACIWRDFAAELGLARGPRARQLRPYLRLLASSLAALPRLVMARGRPEALHPFYQALFDAGKQLGFSWQTFSDGGVR